MSTTQPQEYRIERTGNLLVYIPVAPQPTEDAHTLRRELSVASA